MYKMTEEHKRNISKAMKGRASGMRGRKHSAESIEKMKKTFFAKGHQPWNKGKTGVYTKEHLKKISEKSKELGLRPPSQLGVKQSPEAIAKKVAKCSGKLHWNWQGGITPETQERINDSKWKEK